MSQKRLSVRTLVCQTRFYVPHKLYTINEVGEWIADKFHMPREEVALIVNGHQLQKHQTTQSLLKQNIHEIYLLALTPLSRIHIKCLTIYVLDTTRPRKQSNKYKTYAVRMRPHQTVQDLRQKLWLKSSCSIPVHQQRFVVRGREVTTQFSLREYVMTQRKNRVMFFLSKRNANC